jgi:2-methylisocitrate lyase-like PEP mutase family enzyme
MSAQNNLAKAFKRLHVPGRPVVLANIYDTLSAQAVAELPSCKALATASYGVARANGTEDDDMTMEINLEAVRKIAPVAKAHNKPLSVDVQDAYGDKLEEAITGLVKMGVVGVNLEDCDKDTQKM